MEDEDDDFLSEDIEESAIDLAVPFQRSVRQIILEVRFYLPFRTSSTYCHDKGNG